MAQRTPALDDDEISRLAQTIFETTLAVLVEKQLTPADEDRETLFSAIYWTVRNARPSH